MTQPTSKLTMTLKNDQSSKVSGSENFAIALEKTFHKYADMIPQGTNQGRLLKKAMLYMGNDKNIMATDTKKLILGIMNETQLGLEFGQGSNTDFYVVPFANDPVIIRTYNGWLKVISKFSSKEVSTVFYRVIFEGEKVRSFDQTTGIWDIESDVDCLLESKVNDYKKIKGAIGHVIYKDGTFSNAVTMNKAELDAVKSVSKSAHSSSSPWFKFPIKMVEAKIIKEICKKVPLNLSDNQREAMLNDEAVHEEEDGLGGTTTQSFDSAQKDIHEVSIDTTNIKVVHEIESPTEEDIANDDGEDLPWGND